MDSRSSSLPSPELAESLDGIHIGIDVDGTAAEHLTGICRRGRDLWGLDLYPEDVTEWNFDLPGVDKEFVDLVKECYSDDDFIRDMPPLPGAVETIQDIHEAGATVSIVTHRPEPTLPATKDWLADHDIPYDNFIGDAPDDKSEVGTDILVDDHYKNVANMAEAGKHGILILRPFNYNRIPDHENVHTPIDGHEESPEKIVERYYDQWNGIRGRINHITTRL